MSNTTGIMRLPLFSSVSLLGAIGSPSSSLYINGPIKLRVQRPGLDDWTTGLTGQASCSASHSASSSSSDTWWGADMNDHCGSETAHAIPRLSHSSAHRMRCYVSKDGVQVQAHHTKLHDIRSRNPLRGPRGKSQSGKAAWSTQ